jgi:hypothetical protein
MNFNMIFALNMPLEILFLFAILRYEKRHECFHRLTFVITSQLSEVKINACINIFVFRMTLCNLNYIDINQTVIQGILFAV